jgi:hypothetical protein
MHRKILPIAVLSFISFAASAQLQRNAAYAITGDVPGSYNWNEIRIVDLASGQSLKPVFSSKQEFVVKNARTNQVISNLTPDMQPFSTMAAAAAYDAKHNRLYYTPMGINQLRYVDLNQSTPTFNYVVGENFGISKGLQDQPNHITRMVIDAGGVGYAMSNDGEHFIRFSTGRKMTITDLGAVTDDANNKISIHSSCTSYGGDMVAGNDGKLYVISAFNHIFSIDPSTKVAVYMGSIKGLPANFTSNGAAVDEDGNLIVACATQSAAMYMVDMKSMEATQVKGGAGYNVSDLASGNLLFQKNKSVGTPELPALTRTKTEIGIYPNPSTDGYFKMTFNNVDKGNYQVELVDIVGRVISRKSVTIATEGQVEQIDVRSIKTKGVYMVRLVSQDMNTVFTDKLMIQ